jgi:hypothetical protein
MPQLQMSPPPIARACTGEQHEQVGVGPAIVLSPRGGGRRGGCSCGRGGAFFLAILGLLD